MSVKQIALSEVPQLIESGQSMIVGGFGLTGYPTSILESLSKTELQDITYISNNVGEPGHGGGLMLRNKQISKVVGSFFTSNREVLLAQQAGELEVQLIPQGDLAEAIRAGGAGLGGYFTPTSAGTLLAEGRETRLINGREMVFMEPIRADVAIIRAWRADRAGNLQYRMTENNFNQAAAMAADLVIVEVEEIVETGEIAPEHVHTPGCLVDYVVVSKLKPEHLGSSASVDKAVKQADAQRMQIARAALEELKAGDVVNLGVGIPTLVADLITPDMGINLHSENGMLGVGPEPESGGAMDYPVNASKVPVTALPGASYFDSATSFALIRGGHIDVAVIGGLQVDANANLANWAVPGKPVLGVGGAMDLAEGARRLIVAMTHCDKSGNSKIVPEATLPLTSRGTVDTIVTERAVFRFIEGQLTLVRLQDGFTVDDIQSCTDAEFAVAI